MSILESVKTVFSGTSTPAALCDTGLRLLWKNSGSVPDSIIPEDFLTEKDEPPVLPIEKECLLRYRTGSAAIITPLSEDGRTVGYLVRFHDVESIERLIVNSYKLREQEAMISNIRIKLQNAVETLENPGVKDYPLPIQQAFHSVKSDLLRSFSSSINFFKAGRVFAGMLDITDIELSTQLRKIVDRYAAIIDPKLLRVMCRPGRGVCVLTDIDMLEYVLLNLIVNAYMYNDAKEKEVMIRLTSEGEEYGVLTVEDNGTSADLEYIERASHYTGVRPDSWLGECLGLPIAREFAERCGGSIAFEHSETGGLKVIIKLPVYSDEDVITFQAPSTGKIYLPFDPVYCVLAKAFDAYQEPSYYVKLTLKEPLP